MVVIKWGSEVEGSNTSPAVFVQYSVQKLLRFKTFQNYIVRCECDRRMLLMDVDALRGGGGGGRGSKKLYRMDGNYFCYNKTRSRQQYLNNIIPLYSYHTQPHFYLTQGLHCILCSAVRLVSNIHTSRNNAIFMMNTEDKW